MKQFSYGPLACISYCTKRNTENIVVIFSEDLLLNVNETQQSMWLQYRSHRAHSRVHHVIMHCTRRQNWNYGVGWLPV